MEQKINEIMHVMNSIEYGFRDENNKNINYESVYKLISLNVHSSLDAVGLTAAFSTKLAEKNISANVVAAYYHDHIFVPEEKAEQALAAISEFRLQSHPVRLK